MQRDTRLLTQHDIIATTGLYLRVDNEKVMLILFTRENSRNAKMTVTHQSGIGLHDKIFY